MFRVNDFSFYRHKQFSIENVRAVAWYKRKSHE